MPAPQNTITADALAEGMSREMNRNFEQEADRLMEILGITDVEIMSAGSTLFQLKVTGELNEDKYVEGEDVPLSAYKTEKVPVGTFEVEPFRKSTTAQAILKSGYTIAVGRTDDKMIKQVRARIIKQFFKYLRNAKSFAVGATLQAALSYIDSKLGDVLEDGGDDTEEIAHFVNRTDIADYLAQAKVTTQTVYGMQYLEDFLGIRHVFITNKVAPGEVFATPVDNIRIFGVDFAELEKAGLVYETSANGLIGVHHTPAYKNVSAETNVLTGMLIMAEVQDYVAWGRIGTAIADMTVDELKAFCAERDITLADTDTTKDKIKAAIEAAYPGMV